MCVCVWGGGGGGGSAGGGERGREGGREGGEREERWEIRVRVKELPTQKRSKHHCLPVRMYACHSFGPLGGNPTLWVNVQTYIAASMTSGRDGGRERGGEGERGGGREGGRREGKHPKEYS